MRLFLSTYYKKKEIVGRFLPLPPDNFLVPSYHVKQFCYVGYGEKTEYEFQTNHLNSFCANSVRYRRQLRQMCPPSVST